MKIRTITAGLTVDAECSQLVETVQRLAGAQVRFEDAGYEVQTIRVATQPIQDLVGTNAGALRDIAGRIHKNCEKHDFQFVSLGPINGQGCLALTDAVPDVLAEHEMLNASITLASNGEVDPPACRAAAEVIGRLARETAGGIGNFRFAGIAGCPPGIPFFPSAYHDGGEPTLAIGLQSADLVEEAFAEADGLADAGQRLTALLGQRLAPVEELGEALAEEFGWRYLGIDLSPAPMADVSIARAFETLGLGQFGEAGTLSVAAVTTRALDRVDVKKCGFSGLMFPVLEDAVLGQRNAEGRFDVQDLLLYSSVCGTGLDTVPIPGNTPPERIERLLLDVASLSLRLNKPLSVRLFPVPGKAAGETTTFESPYLTNSPVMNL
ncbi:MAG: hypothetical protein MAG451_01528 [Anaerolineales bacterium]|nr:hypothetical protein [Anaerolineales bacterium]